MAKADILAVAALPAKTGRKRTAVGSAATAIQGVTIEVCFGRSANGGVRHVGAASTVDAPIRRTDVAARAAVVGITQQGGHASACARADAPFRLLATTAPD